VEAIKQINLNLPKDASEITVQINEDKVVISGTANDPALGVAETAYKNSPFFSNVELKKFETGNDSATSGNFTFNLQISKLNLRTLPTVVPTGADQTVQPTIIPGS
jgi:hypothetical protein